MSDHKQRVIQEYVPGKQITLAHVIANPTVELYERMGLRETGAIGIVTLTPSETAIIAGDIATKAASIEIGFLDRFTGSLIITGDVMSVSTALQEINATLESLLRFSPCSITKT